MQQLDNSSLPHSRTPESEFREQFRYLLRESRKEAGLSDLELARRTKGVSATGVRKIEAGQRRPSWRIIELLVKSLPGSVVAQRLGEVEENRTSSAVTNPAEFRRVFGQLLRRSRDAVGLTVRELGRRANVNPSYLSRMERGAVPPPKLSKLSAIVRELPGTELADIAARTEGDKLRHEALHLTARLLEVVGGLSSRAMAHDPILKSELECRLQTCLKILEVTTQQNPTRSEVHTDGPGGRSKSPSSAIRARVG